MRLKGFLMTVASTIAGTFEPNILLFDVLPMTSTTNRLRPQTIEPQAFDAWAM
jgi:hypothetical protein